MIRRRLLAVAAAAATLVVVGCSSPVEDPAARPSSPRPSASTAPGHHGAGASLTPPRSPLREGERFVTVTMPTAYQPQAPNTSGTDDYRCFLLDPRLTRTSVVTGIDVLPGSPKVVHHVILFRVPPDRVARAEQADAAEEGQGWTCFGGTGVDSQGGTLDSAPWLGAWAPGGGERVLADDLGMPLAAGSRIIMQVHYNLLAGGDDDRSSARLRVAADDGSRSTLETVLLPGPVELPCRPGHTGSLCNRDIALLDVRKRFGAAGGMAANALHVLCGFGDAGPTQSCTRPVSRPSTIRAVAGHMHLLGRSISIVVNQGRADERTVLDVPVWNFDDQGSRPVDPGLEVGPGDTLTVRCTHDQSLRDALPAFEGLPERYVVWGEGTTDEMCLGIVMVTRPQGGRVQQQTPTAPEPGREFVLTVSCPDRRGIVHAVSGVMLDLAMTIVDSQQFADATAGEFHLRMHLARDGDPLALDDLRAAMAPVAARFGMQFAAHDLSRRTRVLVMVSQQGHCLNDLLFRVESSSLPVEVPAIVSNHEDFRDLAQWHGVPFHHVPVSREGKPAAEARLRELVAELEVDAVVLARYMQILSPELCADFPGRIINIHHSLLPSFKGAKPYTQAHDRGVKVIGATAHYVTADLDEGPIIEQDFRRVDHRMSPGELASVGRELEAMALARAVRWHAEHRVVLRGRRTIVFD